jgi:hypothetical protein
MDLREFISDPKRLEQLAKSCKSHPGYLRQIATGWRGAQASFKLALLIEEKTKRIGPEAVPKESLRPDIWPSTQRAA